MFRLLEEVVLRPLTTIAQDVLYSRDRLADLDKVAQKHTSLEEKLEVETDLSVGLNMSIRHRKPVLENTFLA